MEKIGLQALFEDQNFQAGVARYVSGLNRATSSTQHAASQMSGFGHMISTAIGTAFGFLTAQAIPKLIETIAAPISVMRSWGEQLDTLGDTFGMGAESATGFSTALRVVGLNVDEGIGAFSYFTRQISATKDQISQAGSAFSDTSQEIRSNFVKAQQEASENLAQIWIDFREKRIDIEQNLAEQITGIQDALNERLADIAEQRLDVDRDLDKSLTKLDRNMKDRIRNARGRERRELRKEWKEQRAELIEQANERKSQLDKQEAREKAHAEKQIQLAERVAQKQIDAAEKAGQKQVEAIIKALKKEETARDEALKKAAKTQGASVAQSPIAKALKTLGLDFKKVTDQSRPFEERLGDIMDAFAKLPEGVDASAVAIELFGRAGLRWLDFLRLGRKGLQDAKQLGIDLGLVLDPQEVELFTREMNKLQLGFDAIGITIGNLVLPAAMEFVKWMNTGLKEGLPIVRGLLDEVTKGFKEEGLTGAFKALQSWKDRPENKRKIDDAMQAIGQVMSDMWQGFIGTTAFVGDALGAMLKAVGQWASTEEGYAWIKAAMSTLGKALGTALEWFITTTATVANFMITLSTKIIRWVQSPDGQAKMADMAKAFTDAFGQALSGGNALDEAIYRAFGMSEDEIRFRMKYGMNASYPGSGKWYAQGGWVPNTGPAFLHAGEYVLNPQQARVMAPMLSNNYSRSYSVTVPQTFYGQQSSVDLQRIKQSSYEGTMRAIRDAANKA